IAPRRARGNPAWSPDGSAIAFDTTDAIWTVNAAGAGLCASPSNVVATRPRPGGGNAARDSAPGRIRTCGLALRRRTLYPLSYRRVTPSVLGEAAPDEHYAQSPESALAYVQENAEALGTDPFALDEIMRRLPERELAARSAIDAALHDLCGKLTQLPVWRLLGLERAGPPTSW